jgi:thiol-disulfide isomerase/thioredoxin
MGVLMRWLRTVGLVALGVALWATASAAQIDQNGKTYDLTQPPTRITVVDFTASWCIPCWKSLPRLQALAAQTPEVEFLVVTVADEVDGRDQLVSRINLTLPVICDENHQLAERFAPQGIPATFVLDAEGSVIYHDLGYDQDLWSEFVRFLEQQIRSQAIPQTGFACRARFRRVQAGSANEAPVLVSPAVVSVPRSGSSALCASGHRA